MDSIIKQNFNFVVKHSSSLFDFSIICFEHTRLSMISAAYTK